MTQIGAIIGGIIGAVALATIVYGIFQYKYSRRPFTHVPKNSKFLDPEYNAGIRSGLTERNIPTTHGVPTVVDNSAYSQQQQQQSIESHPAYAPPYETTNHQTPYETQPAFDLQRPAAVAGSGIALGSRLSTDGTAYNDAKESPSFNNTHHV